MNSLKRTFTFQKDQEDVQSLIKKAIVPTNRYIDWDTSIKICTIINSKKGACRKARITICKNLYAFEEPQTQYLVVTLLKEICFNCAIFEDELRDVKFIDSLREIWYSKIHQNVRNILGELLTALAIKYYNDLYMHHLLKLCEGVGCYYKSQAPRRNCSTTVHNRSYTPNRNADASSVTQNRLLPENNAYQFSPTALSNEDPFNDIRNVVDSPGLAGSLSTPTSRVNPIQMIMDINSKGHSATSEPLSRFEMDELLNQAEITIKLFKETFESSTKDNDLLEDLYRQSKITHHRLIQQAWLLDNDVVYQEAMLDAARNIYFLLNEYKKSD